MNPAKDLAMWVVYKHPADHPEHFVVRRRVVNAEGKDVRDLVCTVHSTLEEARASVPEGLYRLPRYVQDDPVIVEVWL